MQKLENKKRTFAFVFQCSVEYKSLLLSGLYKKLKKDHNVIGIMKDCSSKYSDEYSDEYGLRVYKFNEKYFQHETLKIESLASASRKARHRIKKIGNFGYFSVDRKIRWTDYLIGSYFVFSLLHILTLKKVKKHYIRNDIFMIYKKLGITDIVLCGYSNDGNKLFAINAQQLDVNIWITLNNWKDLYVNNFIPFHPSGIFTWSDEMKEEYLKRNFHLRSGNFSVTGNPAFDRFYNFRPKHDRNYYEVKYGIRHSQPILLYTLLAPDTYAHELESIQLISNLLKNIYLDSVTRPLLLLRRNPLDSVNLNKSRLDENIVFADHYFEGNKEKGIIIQSQEGEDEWLDLIYHAQIVINVASTVTLEALMLDTPVINIEFNGKGTNEPLLKKFTDAPFYVTLLKREDVTVSRTIEDCKKALIRYLEKNDYQVTVPAIIGNFDGQASKRIVNTMISEDNK